VRQAVVKWLAENKDFAIDSDGTKICDFMIDMPWQTYVKRMSRNGTWGDQFTLIAAAEVYGVSIQTYVV
jgi:hypothetical protein